MLAYIPYMDPSWVVPMVVFICTNPIEVQHGSLMVHQALAVLYLYAASTGGHPGALMAMGYRHLHGYGVPQAAPLLVMGHHLYSRYGYLWDDIAYNIYIYNIYIYII